MYHIINNTNDASTIYLTTTNLIDLYAEMLDNPTEDALFNDVAHCKGGRASFVKMLDKIEAEYGLVRTD